MTSTEARAAVRWFQKRAGITDWTIRLDFQDSQPAWVNRDDAVSAVTRTGRTKRAAIWISPTRAQEDGTTLLRNLFHECLHVAEEDVGLPTTTDRMEYFIERLAAICETAYLADTKRVK